MTHSIAPAVQRAVPYDPLKDFAPVILVTRGSPSVLVVSKEAPWNSAGELVDWIRAHPGKASYGSSGAGTIAHLNGAALAAWGELKMRHAPHKDATAALADLATGHITFVFDSVAATQASVLAGSVKALGVAGAKRAAQLPKVRSLAESRLAGFNPGGTYIGMWAPAATPRAAVERLNNEMNELLHKYDLTADMEKLGLETAGGSPEDLAELVARELAGWRAVGRKAGLKL
jgi:tripartite-type tricarboxylate transporter receptor subunit TctC